MSIGKGIRMGGKAVILIIFSVFTIFPFIWMIISALKTKQEIMDVSSFFPETFQWQNFVSVFTDSPLMRYVGNSLYISVFTLLIQIITGAMIAYAIVFLTFKGRGVLFGIIMCTYMVPTAATYIPSYIILSDMKLLDTYFRDFPAAPGVHAGAKRSGGGGQDRWRKPLEDPVESSMPDHKIVIYHFWFDEFYQLLQQLHVAIPDHGLRFQDDGIPGTSEIFH